MAGETNIFGIANLGAVEDKVAAFVDAFGRQYGFTAKDVLTQVMRMWVDDVMKLTPPYSGKQLSNMGKSGNGSAWMLGKKAVERDLHRLFTMPKDTESWWKTPGGKVMARFTDGAMATFGLVDGDIAAHHKQHRNNRGRVGKIVPRMFITKASQFNKYLKAEKAAVGRLKAGWVPAIAAFGGDLPPPWISANPRGQAGSAASMMDDKGNGYLVASNKVPYAFQKLIGIARASGVTRMKHLDRAMRTKAGEQLINLINQHKTVEEATATMNGGKMVAE